MSTPTNNAIAPPLAALDAQQLMQMFQFQSQQITSLLSTVQLLLAAPVSQNTQVPLQQLPSPVIPHFRQYDEAQEKCTELLQQFEAYATVHRRQGTVKLHLFLSTVGSQAFWLVKKLFPTTEPSELSCDSVIGALTSYYEQQINVVAARYQFFQCRKSKKRTSSG